MTTRPETRTEARRADRITERRQTLAAAVAQREQADATIAKTVAGLRRDAVSWGIIAGILKVTRQAAMQRFDKKPLRPRNAGSPGGSNHSRPSTGRTGP